VYFDCDEQSYLRFQERAHRGSGVSSANPVRVALANETGFPHAGRVDFLDNQVNAATGTIRARVVLNNPDRIFTPGLYARVRLESSGEQQALLIDDKAVLTDQDRKYVYVLGAGNTAQRKDVELGPLVDGLRIVQSGLGAGDKVIVSGLQKIFYPGVPVTPMESATEPSHATTASSLTPAIAQ
jgi:membrane fusion protein, multidrug efflux system